MILFRWLSIRLLRLSRLTGRHPRLTTAGVLALVVMASFQLTHLKSALAIEDLADASFRSTQEFRDLMTTFRIGNPILIVVTPKAPATRFTLPELCALRDWVSAQAASNPDVHEISSPFSARSTRRQGDRVSFPFFMDLKCREGERDANVHDAAEAEAAFHSLADSPWGGVLTRRDHQSEDLLLEIQLEDAPSGGRYGSFDPKASERLRAGFNRSLGPYLSGISAHWVGAGDFEYYMYLGMARVSLLNLVMLAFLVFLLRGYCGTYRAGAYFIGTLIPSGILVYGIMAAFGARMDILSKSLFLMLAVSALEDFVFLSSLQFETESGPPTAHRWRRPFRKMLVAGFLTSLTTVLGFGSLCASELGIIRNFGLWASAAAALEWGMIFFALPAVISSTGMKASWVNPERAWLSRWINRLDRQPAPRGWGRWLVAVSILGLIAVPRLRVADYPHDVFPKNHDFRLGLNYLRDSRGWESSVSLVFADGSSETENRAVIQAMAKNPNVARIVDPYSMTDYLTRGMQPGLAASVSDLFKRSEAYRHFQVEFGPARATLYIRDNDIDSLAALEESLATVCPRSRCHLAGGFMPYAEFTRRVASTLLESFAISLLLVMLLLAWLAAAMRRPWQEALAVVVTSAWGPLLMVGVVAALGINVNFLTCMYASVLVGLTGDNAIQYLIGARHRGLREGIRRRGRSSIACSGIMIAASFIFLGSYFIPPRVFGMLLAAGLLASLYGDRWILEALLPQGPSASE